MKLYAPLLFTAIASTLLVTGCSSKPERVEPRKFESNHSYAYNIANQTSLLRNGSPLKDFTPEEIKSARSALNKNGGGGLSVGIGVIKILTGNLTGAIDVVGGKSANISNSKHHASFSSWIVSIDAKGIRNGFDAKNHVSEEIKRATMEVLESSGHRVEKIKFNNG